MITLEKEFANIIYGEKLVRGEDYEDTFNNLLEKHGFDINTKLKFPQWKEILSEMKEIYYLRSRECEDEKYDYDYVKTHALNTIFRRIDKEDLLMEINKPFEEEKDNNVKSLARAITFFFNPCIAHSKLKEGLYEEVYSSLFQVFEKIPIEHVFWYYLVNEINSARVVSYNYRKEDFQLQSFRYLFDLLEETIGIDNLDYRSMIRTPYKEIRKQFEDFVRKWKKEIFLEAC